jgi:hypothetical protein
MPVSSDILLKFYKTNTVIIHRQVNGISHEESLMIPPFGANCINWVIGHILTNRDTCLALMNLPRLLTKRENEVYTRGSLPLVDAAQAADLTLLLEKLDLSLRQITAAIEERDADQMVEMVTFGVQPQPLNEVLHFLMWHETYHTGQLELLRQFTGRTDKII